MNEMWGKFRYVDMTAPERIVFISSFSDAAGNTVRAGFAEDFPLEIYNVWTLTEVDGKTVLELGGGPLASSPEETAFYHGLQTSMQQGFGGTFQQLDEYLASVQL